LKQSRYADIGIFADAVINCFHSSLWKGITKSVSKLFKRDENPYSVLSEPSDSSITIVELKKLLPCLCEGTNAMGQSLPLVKNIKVPLDKR
jgi:hypothetical protein